MKKSLLIFAIALGVGALVGCTHNNGWNEKNRKAVHDDLRNYRDMIYVEDLQEIEFEDFSGDVIDAIEIDYPLYTVYYELPARGDTLDVYVVSTIVERLDTDPHNLRHIFPYSWLVSEGILPSEKPGDQDAAPVHRAEELHLAERLQGISGSSEVIHVRGCFCIPLFVTLERK